jgi:leucine dehydrogenase
MTLFQPIATGGHELVLLASDPTAGYRGIIAVHSTALGTAVGGTRWWTYPTDEAALEDALRLSRGMSYKNALADLPVGGGKGVILGGGNGDRRAVLRAHGRAIDRLGGLYITGEDVGTSVADMEIISETTKFVAGRAGTSGDPSPNTGRGVMRAMQAGAHFRWGSDSLEGRTVAIQGCGNVGYHLAKELSKQGAKLIVADLDATKVERVVAEFGAKREAPERIHRARVDIYAPCALGAVLNDQSIPELQAELVVGGANNQLLEPRHGAVVEGRGIGYVPDYVANAGGVAFGAGVEVQKLTREQALAKVDRIYETTLMVLERAKAEKIPASEAADRIGEERIQAAQRTKG